MDDQNNQAELDAVLFLDANVKSIQHCKMSRCETKKHIFCRHRFLFNFKWFREEDAAHFIRPFDHQVILYCLWLIYKYRWVGYLAQSDRFFLITHDHNFLRDAESEWSKRVRKRTSPKINFEKDRVVIGKFTIIVKTVTPAISGRNRVTNEYKDLLRVVEELNILLGKK
mgnify:FL=1